MRKFYVLDVEYLECGGVNLVINERKLALPRHKHVRIAMGSTIAVVGLLPFLPITIVGIYILSIDVPVMARAREGMTRRMARGFKKGYRQPRPPQQPKQTRPLALPNTNRPE